LDLDEPLTHVIALEQGLIRQYSVSKNGDEFTHNIFRPGTIFPLNLIFHRQTNPYYFEALTAGQIRLVPAEQMIDFLQKHPKLLLALVKRMASGINQLIYRMESIVFGSAQQKIAAAIYLLARRFGQPIKEIELPKDCQKTLPLDALVITDFSVTHQHIAFLTALTRETVSVEMMNLKEMGVIDYQKQMICVLDPKKLKNISSLPFYSEAD
jgi:CRP-like cAMP-binding protein